MSTADMANPKSTTILEENDENTNPNSIKPKIMKSSRVFVPKQKQDCLEKVQVPKPLPKSDSINLEIKLSCKRYCFWINFSLFFILLLIG